MDELAQILDKIKKIRPELERKYSIKEIGVFGSYVRGEQKPDSDVDILVDFNKIITLFQFSDIELLLNDCLNKKVDLVMKNALKPRIGRNILQEVRYL